MKRYNIGAMLVKNGYRLMALARVDEHKKGKYVEYKDVEDLEKLAQIGRDYQYLSTHEEVCGLPTVEDMQKLANKRRAQEGIE